MGMGTSVSRSTLADANETRDWRIFADFAHVLIAKARTLYCQDEFGLELDETVYALDSTTIDLCLALFPWAHFRRSKGAIKLHTLLDVRGSIPSFIHITDGKVHDVNVLDVLVPEPGSFYVMDRGYLDFARLTSWRKAWRSSSFDPSRIFSSADCIPIQSTKARACVATKRSCLTGPLTSPSSTRKNCAGCGFSTTLIRKASPSSPTTPDSRL